MEFFNHICPNSPYIWSTSGVSKCFDDIFLGFGVNVVSVIIVVALGITERKANQNMRMYMAEMLPFRVLPMIGALVACIDIVFLLRKTFSGDTIMYYEWLLRFSQLLVWVTILLVSKCNYWFFVASNRLMCVWWIVKSFLWVPHLHATFYSLEAVLCIKESLQALLDVMFGILIIFTRIKWPSQKSSLAEDLLVSHETDIEQGHQVDPGNAHSIWQLMTFSAISSVLERGAKKQLDFEDLLELPADMDPLSCHQMLLSCWETQKTPGFSHPSLFRAICCAYGWSYMRLGLLKILNDCLGFAGPLLLNKLIRYLQEGGENFDGYIFAMSLGFASILKSFFDTQYTFHLSKLKLKIRSSIMANIFHKCLCVSLAERSKFSEGEIQTYMSVDADRTVNLCNSFHDMWRSNSF